MTTPAFIAVGTASETAPTWPAGHAVGDFALLFIQNPDATVTTPSGWTRVCPQLGNTGDAANDARFDIFYRFATSTSESAPSISGSSNHNWGVIVTYSGVNRMNPIHNQSTMQSGGTTNTAPGLTTYLDECLVIIAYSWGVDNAGPLASAETNAGLGSLTERYDGGTTTGNGGGIVVADGTLATKGTIDVTRTTFSTTPGSSASIAIALQATNQSYGRKSRLINTRM